MAEARHAERSMKNNLCMWNELQTGGREEERREERRRRERREERREERGGEMRWRGGRGGGVE